MYTVYILQCQDKTLYTGIALDLKKRFQLHLEGRASKYTRSHKPKKIVYTETYKTKSQALRREIAIKKLTRQQKLLLIKRGH